MVAGDRGKDRMRVPRGMHRFEARLNTHNENIERQFVVS